LAEITILPSPYEDGRIVIFVILHSYRRLANETTALAINEKMMRKLTIYRMV